jgi:hypothetical protein
MMELCPEDLQLWGGTRERHESYCLGQGPRVNSNSIFERESVARYAVNHYPCPQELGSLFAELLLIVAVPTGGA